MNKVELERRFNFSGALRLLACECGYLVFFLAMYLALTDAVIGLRAFFFTTIGVTFTLLLIAWAIAFKVYRK